MDDLKGQNMCLMTNSSTTTFPKPDEKQRKPMVLEWVSRFLVQPGFFFYVYVWIGPVSRVPPPPGGSEEKAAWGETGLVWERWREEGEEDAAAVALVGLFLSLSTHCGLFGFCYEPSARVDESLFPSAHCWSLGYWTCSEYLCLLGEAITEFPQETVIPVRITSVRIISGR